MCNLYAQTKGPAAIRDLVRAVRDFSGNLEPLPAIFPDQVAPVVMTDPMGDRTIIPMRWGFAGTTEGLQSRCDPKDAPWPKFIPT